MRRSLLRAWRALPFLLLAAAARAAEPQSAACSAEPKAAACAAEPQDAGGEDLYLQALQSIAEGRRSDATAELRRVIEQSPTHAGAWLELALTHCALGNSDEAERLFAIIETRFNPAPALLELIAQTREQGCSRWNVFSSTMLTASRGIDQNVNQGARTTRYTVDGPKGQVEYELSGDFRPRRDQYIQVMGETLREMTPNGVLGFAQYQFRRNDSLHQYDTGSLFTGLEAPYRWGRWRLRATGTLGLVTLGGQLYQRQAQLQGRVVAPLPLPAGMQFHVIGALTRNSFPALSNFDSSTQELRGYLSWRAGDTYLSATLGYTNDHALAQRPGGNRKGMFANLLVRRSLGHGISTELGYSRQTSNSSEAYSPDVIEEVRRQTTQVLRGSVSYALDKRHFVVLEARAVRNRENISIFQYNNRQLQLSWQWQLP